jgi:hypothetical protein
VARPTVFTAEFGEKICERIAEGEMLTIMCKDREHPSYHTVYKWIDTNAAFAKSYKLAKELQAHAFAEKAVQTAMAATPDSANAARVKFDAQRWYAAKLLPVTYSDKTQVDHTGKITLEALVAGSMIAATTATDAKTIEGEKEEKEPGGSG